MKRPGAWNRKEMRKGILVWSRQRWRELLPLVALFGGGALVAWLSPLPAFAKGLVVGVFLTMLVCLLTVIVVVGSGQLPRLWGVGGEVATAEVFSTRRRRRQGWAVVNGLRLNTEVDHVAIGPGGILAVESKWAPTDTWRVEGDRLIGPKRDPLAQARRAARNVAALLAEPRCGRLQLEVIPVVAIWGPGAPAIADGHVGIDGVWLFSGNDPAALDRWLDEPRLDPTAVSAARRAVEEYAGAQAAS